jgi:hypothetical protein
MHGHLQDPELQQSCGPRKKKINLKIILGSLLKLVLSLLGLIQNSQPLETAVYN